MTSSTSLTVGMETGHIELSNDNPISEKFRNENDVTYRVDAFVHVVLGKV
jgi:hypothetical protein